MKRGIITLRPDLIARMLSLPEDVRVRSVNANWETDTIEVMLEGEGLPDDADYIPGAYPVRLDLAVTMTDEGKIEVKW